MYRYMYNHIYTYIQICMYVCIYIYIHDTYTYITYIDIYWHVYIPFWKLWLQPESFTATGGSWMTFRCQATFQRLVQLAPHISLAAKGHHLGTMLEKDGKGWKRLSQILVQVTLFVKNLWFQVGFWNLTQIISDCPKIRHGLLVWSPWLYKCTMGDG